MEVILAKTCQSLIGRLNRSHGYCIRRQGERFFTQRCPANRWPDGHLRFILDLANGKKTMNAYLWLVCGREYDEAQD